MAANRLELLRAVMKKHNVSCYIIPTEDTHMSEYIAHCDKRREYISMFTGSAGTAVVTDNKALLWTDGRYYLQASQQLSPDWTLQKVGLKETPAIKDWIAAELKRNDVVGIDGKLFTIDNAIEMRKTFEEKGIVLKNFEKNFVDQIWTNPPAEPSSPVSVLDLKYTGKSFVDKLTELRKKIEFLKCQAVVITALDEICWLLNMRGQDIDFNPVFKSFCVVTMDNVFLYINLQKLDDVVREYLKGVEIKQYETIYDDLKSMDLKFLVTGKCNVALVESIGSNYQIAPSQIELAKAVKNETELAGFRECHKRDAVALVRYFCWLEKQLSMGISVTEAEGADQLEKFRSELDLFRGLSFDTISGSGANGAIIHYKPEHGSCATIDKNKMYLCDSGGQYLDGTTDVTRTIHFGTPNEEEKECYTRVLQGHIQLDMLVFPPGTTGYRIDILARMHLWKMGLDFRHGTGHGVGAHLNVHEGPHGISFRPSSDVVPLQAGMTVTNEPGFYKDGEFGIRIENVMLVIAKDTPNKFNGESFLGFESVTVAPISTKLVKKELLSVDELNWLNEYNMKCRNLIGPLMNENEEAYQWLIKETVPI